MSQQQHQLAAILFTDVAGYTALMQENEQKAMELIRHYNRVLEPAMETFHGKIANNYGDGSLCLFSSAFDAVRAAIRIQEGLQVEPVVPLRIGLHIGEVFYEDGKVFGDGVNVASRVQSLGQPNTILFSRDIYDKIRNHAEYSNVSLGHFAFKNVADPLEVFALTTPGLRVPDKRSLEGKLQEKKKTPGKWLWLALSLAILTGSFLLYNLIFRKSGFSGKEKSIAVIPFINNDSLDKNDEYLCYGIPERIVGLLSKINSLEVKSLNSSIAFRGSNLSNSEISTSLNHPNALVKGHIEKLVNKIIVSVELIDVATNNSIWSNTYQIDLNGDEILSIANQVAQQVTRELEVHLDQDQKKNFETLPTKSREAYEYYLRARDFQKSLTSNNSNWKNAEEQYIAALKKDSTFALAWAGLAGIYNFVSNGVESKLQFNNKSLHAIYQTLKYDPQNSEARVIMGELLKKYTLNPELSLSEFREAIRLNPNNSNAYVYQAAALIELNRRAEASSIIEKAIQLDPASGQMTGFDPWEYYAICTGDTIRLKYLLKKYTNSSYTWNNLNRMIYFEFSGKYDSLLSIAKESNDTLFAVKALMGLGATQRARQLAQQRVSQLTDGQEGSKASTIARYYAAIGNTPKAIEFLNKAYDLRQYDLITIRIDHDFDVLRKEKGFQDLVERLSGDQ